MRVSVLLTTLVVAATSVRADIPPLAGPWLKPGETLACYGDSLTDWEPGYVTILREELAKWGVKVVNAGHAGDNTCTGLARVREVAALKADAVLIFFGTNDSACGRGWWRDEPTICPEGYRDNLRWMVHYLRKWGKVKKFSIAPAAGRIEGGHYRQFGNGREAYNLMTRDAADWANAVFVPLDVVFDEARKTKPFDAKGYQFTRDCVHFNEEGCKLVVKTMLEAWKMNGPSHVVAKIADSENYRRMRPRFKKAFEFLRRPDLSSLAVGRYEIDGTNCWATVADADLAPLAERKLEAHRRYIDIQSPITGPETIGLMETGAEQLALPFNDKDDYVLFEGEKRPVTLQPGEFGIFFPPRGAHAPGCRAEGGPAKIRKLVIKVLAD